MQIVNKMVDDLDRANALLSQLKSKDEAIILVDGVWVSVAIRSDRRETGNNRSIAKHELAQIEFRHPKGEVWISELQNLD